MPAPPLRKKIGIITYPLAALYGSIVAVRNILFNCNILKSIHFNIPVISVGNITVGGTGKTPHVEYLINLLKDDFRVAVLSRGYMRKTKEFILADKKANPETIGDEPYQMFIKYPEISVAVDRKRVNGIQQLQKRIKKLQLVLLDDAYQHRYVTPGISILLVDYYRPLFKDHLLPYGDLREKKHESQRANIVIVTKCPENITPIEKRLWIKELKLYPYQSLYFTTLSYGKLISVTDPKKKKIKLEDLKKDKYTILLFTGIANVEPLCQKLKSVSKKIVLKQYNDHHDYSQKDLENLMQEFYNIKPDKKIVITTEKDAVKLRNLSITEKSFAENLYYLPIEVEFIGNKKQFDSDIKEYVKKNKRISRLNK